MGWAKYTEDNAEVNTERQQWNNCAAADIVYTGYLKMVGAVVDFQPSPVETEEIFIEKVYSDKRVICRDCGGKFLFTSGAQRQYNIHGWKQPKRCRKCRDRNDIRFAMRPSF